ncbi:hypothetical protein EYF80_024841 [Liparis tanakae]|uniref:Uncharacterized protein n=1 Tax=Liparis tanakae TaxID=230148 RepID=A0A4Z2HGG9_9TELE|nr:hypothetical protein EYF80_024841 [Liparis tanakae]
MPVHHVRVMSSSFSRPQLTVPSPSPFCPSSSSSNKRKLRGTFTPGKTKIERVFKLTERPRRRRRRTGGVSARTVESCRRIRYGLEAHEPEEAAIFFSPGAHKIRDVTAVKKTLTVGVAAQLPRSRSFSVCTRSSVNSFCSASSSPCRRFSSVLRKWMTSMWVLYTDFTLLWRGLARMGTARYTPVGGDEETERSAREDIRVGRIE